MDWINVNDQLPEKYKEVIICSNTKNVKTAIYLGDGKWSTFLTVVLWQPYPEVPDELEVLVDTPKKRGRPKKV